MKIYKLILLLGLGILATGINSCALYEASPGRAHDKLLASWLSEPRYVETELRITIKNFKVLHGEELVKANREMNIPDYTPPTFRIWSSQPFEYINQRNVKFLGVSPEPDERWTDAENGNVIFYWDIAKRMKDGDSLVITRRFRYDLFNFTVPQDIQTANAPDGMLDDAERYLVSEEFLELTDSIKAMSVSIAGGENDPLKKARLFYDWMRGNMKYEWPVLARGAGEALKTCKGDCGQYSYLYIAFCRASNIPARLVSGFMLAPDTLSYHVWSEIQLPGLGWLPVDCTDKNGFLSLDNRRLVTSRGTNIPLPNVPAWATWKNSEAQNGKTDFMQMMTTVISGVKAEVSTRRILHKYSK
ncbi:MAG: transglutaminase domain-containing protein [Ignavibacteria bacterium]|nr:transglutaminase domain-containing protein [Ignavibacteria bacterium]